MPESDAALAGLDSAKVSRWLLDNVDGLTGPVRFDLVSGGRSNLTYRVSDAAGHTYALRRPPTGGVLTTAHDMAREWRFISALASTPVPVPPPVAYCADTAITGAEFYVMGFVAGTVLADEDAGHAMVPQARPVAARDTIETLVALHAVDPAEVGLGDLVRRTGYLERQLRRWHAQVHAIEVPEIGLLDEIHTLLVDGIPVQTTGIVHGDYRPGNLAYSPDGRLQAIFDWELATSGDPMADLGWLIASWGEPGENFVPITPGPSAVEGFGSRDQLVSRYAELSGRDVSDLGYWVAFSLWRVACIGVGVRSRYQAGHMAADGYQADLIEPTRHLEAARAALDAPLA